MLGEVQFEKGRIICPSHDVMKYYMTYAGRGTYKCTGEQFVPVGRGGLKVAQPCMTEIYDPDLEERELTREVARWKRLFVWMSICFGLAMLSNIIHTLQWIGLLP